MDEVDVEMEYAEAYGARVPKVGLGTWQLTGESCYETVSTALELGYRHVDTAQLYGNEAEVGRAIADADVDREDVFLTTKVSPRNARYDDVIESTRASLDRLDTSYVDLLLLHWPNPLVSVSKTVRAMDRLVEMGEVYHVGVSNFPQVFLDRARSASETPIVTTRSSFTPTSPSAGCSGTARTRGCSSPPTARWPAGRSSTTRTFDASPTATTRRPRRSRSGGQRSTATSS
ncbi:aldo/keto reductase [Halobellus rufus]|uniref:aldo/keto reductase n=1 Tax=Halobellus rufus TaxID=1448860 RepID=UPI000B0D2FF3